MNKNVLLIGTIISALASSPVFASGSKDDDDDDDKNPPVVTPIVGGSTTVNNTNNIDVSSSVSNVLDNRNTNTNNNSQAQQQWQEQQQNQTTNAHSTATGGNAVANGGTATASGNGSGNSTVFNQSYSEVYRERLNPVNTALGTNLTSGADTCLGSVSAAVQTQIVGVSGGKTVVDQNCVMIKNTKMLLQMGLPSAACFYLRQDPKIDEAMAAAGVECREPPAVATKVENDAVPVKSEDVPVPFDRATVYK